MVDAVIFHGPTLSNLSHDVLASDGDFEGILFGFMRSTTQREKDDEAEFSTKTVIEACVTCVLCLASTGARWCSSTGRVNESELTLKLAQTVCLPEGVQCLGFCLHRKGVPHDQLSLRDSAMCKDMADRRLDILGTLATQLHTPEPNESTPMLCLQTSVSTELDGAILSIINTVSHLRHQDDTGMTSGGHQPPFELVRKPLVIQNMAKLGGEHLYKKFKPTSGFSGAFVPRDVLTHIQNYSHAQARGLERVYQSGLGAVQQAVDELADEVQNNSMLENALAQLTQQLQLTPA